jgi:hypothetical protein
MGQVHDARCRRVTFLGCRGDYVHIADGLQQDP